MRDGNDNQFDLINNVQAPEQVDSVEQISSQMTSEQAAELAKQEKEKKRQELQSIVDEKKRKQQEVKDATNAQKELEQGAKVEKKEKLSEEQQFKKQMLEDYKSMIEKRKKPVKGNKSMQWLTALGQIGNQVSESYGQKPVKLNESFTEANVLKQNNALDKEKMDLYKAYQSAQQGGESGLSAYQKKSLGLREKDYDLRKLNQEFNHPYKSEREKRLVGAQEHKVNVSDRATPKEIESVAQLDDGVRILDEIDSMLKDTDIKNNLGPYASKIEDAYKYVPYAEKDPNFVKMQQLVGINLSDYVKSISGAQVSEEEAQRLLKNIPNVTDKPGEFKVKLDNFRKNLSDAKKDYIEKITTQRKGAKKLLDSNDGMVTMVAPNGHKKRVKRSQVQKYIDKGAILEE